ncbi:kinase-interacting protein 1-like isoform X2 [Nicotiana tabacum]|uniref:Kinase-interacting protein 1-like isoform X2 n=2 Tax=Nicotiana TaxID=4085 RepID=A0A1S3X4M9_TOBAC|nr:PREDICTED: rho-associated protein kinase 2-like isoform X2 [Nicotiana sylvestris]XP_016434781.1 PREDICTED: kinase-interacting protein 1-like isoform X2 [Nicotiana tabacum]
MQDMQGKVESVIKLIEEDGDSFAKRAEMYYKKRPELINFVEESYRAYRALAERYDHLSKELQTANNTIATIFPEQIQLAMDEEDEYGAPRIPKDFTQIAPSGSNNIPKAPIKDLKGLMTTASKQRQGKKSSKTEDVAKSGLNESEAIEEIDKLQKDILALQTVKEFVRSSYQNGLEKYRGLENQIMEKQQKICELEDEFGEGRVIEDAEACTLMAEAALQSCQETLTQLQEKQDMYAQEAREEFQKIEDSCKKLQSFRHKYLGDKISDLKPNVYNISNQEVGKEIESSQNKIKDQVDASSKESLTMSQLAEKIDELVNKVVNLETAVSSQTLLIERLRREADELQAQVQSLEDDKAALTDDTHNLNIRVTAIEAKLQTIENLNKDVVNQNSSLRTHFVEARTSLDHLSDKLSSVRPDEEHDGIDLSPDEVTTLVEIKLQEELVKQKNHPSSSEGPKNLSTIKTTDTEFHNEQGSSIAVSDNAEVTKTSKKHVTFLEPTVGKGDEKVSAQSGSCFYETQIQKDAEKDDELNWQQMLLSGLEDKENILLNEYTTILKNYKEVTKKLSDMEKKDRDAEFNLTLQIRELKCAITKRDEEIHNLRLKLNLLQQGNGSENKELKEQKCQESDPSFDRSLKPEDLPQRKDKDNLIIENDEEDIKTILVDQHASVSPTEEKLRMSIDAILDENLDFWLRFSSTFHQIQKFKTTFHDLQHEISKIKNKEMQDHSPRVETKSEIKPIYKHMKEIQNELTVWLAQTLSLKDELERKFSALCNIQDEIANALKEGIESDDIRFSSHEAAKFQGQVLNMKQENNKVSEELEAGFRRVTTLQVDVEKTITELDQEFGLTGNQSQLMNSVNRSRIPLHSFIFGTKPKKQKRSLFSRINPNRKY